MQVEVSNREIKKSSREGNIMSKKHWLSKLDDALWTKGQLSKYLLACLHISWCSKKLVTYQWNYSIEPSSS